MKPEHPQALTPNRTNSGIGFSSFMYDNKIFADSFVKDILISVQFYMFVILFSHFFIVLQYIKKCIGLFVPLRCHQKMFQYMMRKIGSFQFHFLYSFYCMINSFKLFSFPIVPFMKTLKEIEILSLVAFSFRSTLCSNHDGNKISALFLTLTPQT